MQPKTLPRYVGVVLLLLTFGYFLGGNQLLSASSHSLVTTVQLQPGASPVSGSTTNDARMHRSSGTATPDTFSDLVLTGACVLIIALLSLSFFLSQRRRGDRQQHLQNPETDPIIARVSIPNKDFLAQASPAQDNSRVARLKNRLRSI